MFDKISKIAEAKAEEKIELMEENRPNYRDSKRSIVDSLVENVLPSITNAIATAQKNDAQAAQAAQGVAQHPMMQQRRVLPPNYRPPQPQAAGLRPPPQTPASPKGNETTGTQGQEGSALSRPSSRSNHEQTVLSSSTLGLPTLPKAEEITKEKVEGLLVPAMGAALLALKNPEAGAKDITNVLQVNRIPVKLFVEYFKKEDAPQIVEKYKLPEGAIVWFEEVYANIETATRMDAPQHTANS